MKRLIPVVVLCLLWGGQSWAVSIHDLLDAAGRQPSLGI